MDLPRRFTIAESSHRIQNPIGEADLVVLGEALGLAEGSTMLDLACGKGELLCQWSKGHGIIGVGLDRHGPFVEAGRARARQLGVQDRVEIVQADAEGYVSPTSVDIASCLGATWIGGGFLGTLDLLSRSLDRRGLAVIGESYWREWPESDEIVQGCHLESVHDAATLPELIQEAQGAGWDVVEMMHADERSWDRYVAPQWHNIRRFIDENPDDPLVPELYEELNTAPLDYVRYQRRYLGWGVLVLTRR